MAATIEKRLVQQGYTFELDPNQVQRVQLVKSVGCSRFVYNWGLADSKSAYEITGKRPKHSDLKKRLVELKQGDARVRSLLQGVEGRRAEERLPQVQAQG